MKPILALILGLSLVMVVSGRQLVSSALPLQGTQGTAVPLVFSAADNAALKALSSGNVIAGPGIVESADTSATGVLLRFDPSLVGSVDGWLTVTNLGDASLSIDQSGSGGVIGIGPGKSASIHGPRLSQGEDFSFAGGGEPGNLKFVWVFR